MHRGYADHRSRPGRRHAAICDPGFMLDELRSSAAPSASARNRSPGRFGDGTLIAAVVATLPAELVRDLNGTSSRTSPPSES